MGDINSTLKSKLIIKKPRFTLDIINKGSEILIEEFPSSEDLIDTKEKIEKI